MTATTPSDTVTELLGAMRRLANSVCVIAVRGPDGTRNAITATSPTSVSMDPPSMLFCVHRDSSLRSAIAEGSGFCINLLATRQEDVARMCSSKARGEERFAVGRWQDSASGVPFLADAEAAILCTTVQIVPFGSHDIVIGTVDEVHRHDPDAPLIYFDGQYAGLALAG